MNKNQIIATIVLSTILIISLIVGVNRYSKNPDLHDDFVKGHLSYLHNLDINAEFESVIIYFSEDEAYLEIVYSYDYKQFSGVRSHLVNRYTGQTVKESVQEYYPDFMRDFNQTKENHVRKIVYTQTDINKLIIN